MDKLEFKNYPQLKKGGRISSNQNFTNSKSLFCLNKKIKKRKYNSYNSKLSRANGNATIMETRIK